MESTHSKSCEVCFSLVLLMRKLRVGELGFSYFVSPGGVQISFKLGNECVCVCMCVCVCVGLLRWPSDKESACSAGDWGLNPGRDPLEKGMAIHSSILAWRILWTEEPGRATVHGVAQNQT